jgi:hypothetical protein
MRGIAAVAATATLTCVFALFASSAFAGDHGQGTSSGGGANDHATGSAQKAAHASTQSTQSSEKAHGGQAKANAHAKASAQVTTSVQGVKPTTATAHNTFAPAASSSTKLYGNGKTAGQIAQQNGANPTAMLHGPGNSQPHKLALCPAGHEVDVHALKSHHGNGCAKQAETTASEHGQAAANANSHATICHATGSTTHPFVVISPSTSGVFHGHLSHQDKRDVAPTFQYNGMTLSQNWNAQAPVSLSSACAAELSSATTPAVTSVTATVQAVPTTQRSTPATATPAAAANAANTSTPAAKATAGSGVKAATAQAAAPKNAAGANGAQNAAGANASQSSGTNLPFTGLPLWLVVLAAGALILTGSVLRRGGRAAR